VIAPKPLPRDSFALIRVLLLIGLGHFSAGMAMAQDDEPIEIKTIAGLRFDPPRFAVKPGAKVKLEIENADDMAHNFVLVAPGARMEIVNAAMTMPITPEQTFIPPSDKILHHTPVLNPGKSEVLEFTAPFEEGVYPYVCTYPGHGMVMFGAMYVTKRGEQELPSLAADEHLPDMIRDQAKTVGLHAYPAEPPYWYRIFMRDSGPASIAVALPGGQNYCWDAGACRLRYAWRGGFVDPLPHWRGNGDAFAEVKGTIYYRPATFPLRFGDAKKAPAEVRFRGFSVVDKVPEFHYSVGSVEVRELIKPAHHGGIEATYKLSGAKGPVYYVTDQGAGADPSSDAGKFIDSVLKIPSDKAKQFTITFIEILNKEPLGYWSMNDSLADRKQQLVEGPKGRAATFDGKKSQVATALKTNDLAGAATFAVWAQITNPPVPEQVCIGAKNEEEEFALGANLAGVPGYGVRVKTANEESKIVAAMPMEADDQWHHLAATLGGKDLRFYFDGKPAGRAAAVSLPKNAALFLGSSGKTNFAGATLDETRIYARVLDAAEIAAIYANERPKTPLKAPTTPAPKATPTPPAKPETTPKPAAAKTSSTPPAKPTPTPPAKTTAKPTPTPPPKTAAKATPTPTPKPAAKPAKPTPTPAKKPTKPAQ
jgi:uncharacterized cupredoxin-like copper-binding protein